MKKIKNASLNIPDPMDSAEQNKVRMTLDLSQKLNNEVESLAVSNGTTKADILRFAIEFLSSATAARRAGMHVGAWSDDPDGKRREREFIGL